MRLNLRDRFKPARLPAARGAILWRSSLIVLQSILAVAVGATLFIAFALAWEWNSLAALALSVSAVLGLVAWVRVIHKAEDIASTLLAVAVGAVLTLVPLALTL